MRVRPTRPAANDKLELQLDNGPGFPGFLTVCPSNAKTLAAVFENGGKMLNIFLIMLLTVQSSNHEIK